MIRVLTELGVPLKTILNMMKERTPAKTLKLLSEQSSKLYANLCRLQEALSVLRVFVGMLRDGIKADESELSVTHMSEIPITLGIPCEFEEGQSFYSEFARFSSQRYIPPLNMSYPIGGFFDSMETFLETPSCPTRFFSANPNGHAKKNEGLYLIGYTRGYYGQTNDLPEMMSDYAKKHKLVFDGPVYNLYLFDELSVNDPEKYLLQVCAQIMISGFPQN
jgi:hypothetical protein